VSAWNSTANAAWALASHPAVADLAPADVAECDHELLQVVVEGLPKVGVGQPRVAEQCHDLDRLLQDGARVQVGVVGAAGHAARPVGLRAAPLGSSCLPDPIRQRLAVLACADRVLEQGAGLHVAGSDNKPIRLGPVRLKQRLPDEERPRSRAERLADLIDVGEQTAEIDVARPQASRRTGTG
jgi:hypothetical protein